MRSDVELSLIEKMKNNIHSPDLKEFNNDYVLFINVFRVILLYIVQYLCDKHVGINLQKIQKFLKEDTDIDENDCDLKESFNSYDEIRKNINTKIKIGKIYIIIIIYRYSSNA